MGNKSNTLKKILVMTFDDDYIKFIGKIIARKDIQMQDELGFCNYENKDKHIIYTFLSSKSRRTWLHHYIGSYAIIIIDESKDSLNDDNNKEIENILSSQILQKRPLLLLFDKTKMFYKSNENLESLRYILNKKKITFNIQYIDFEVSHLNSELLYGLDWLERQIRKMC